MMKAALTTACMAVVIGIGIHVGLAQTSPATAPATSPAQTQKAEVDPAPAKQVLFLKAVLERPEVLAAAGFSAEEAAADGPGRIAKQRGKLLGRSVVVGFKQGQAGFIQLEGVSKEEFKATVESMKAAFGEPSYENDKVTGWRKIEHEKSEFRAELLGPQEDGTYVLAIFAVTKTKE